MTHPSSTRSFLRRGWRIVRYPVFVYAGVLLVIAFFENRLVYRPCTAGQDWQPAPHPDIQDVALRTAGGIELHAWWLPRADTDDTLLFLHGNAGNLSHRGGSILKLREILRSGVLIVDYPGYGKSAGSPSETGCYQAADAGYDFLTATQGKPGERMLLYGGSLGGAVAVDLASRRPHRALILAKTFTSAPDVGARMLPWLPVRWLMRNRFDNLGKIASCPRPIFFAHGDTDEVVPFALGKRLYAAAPEPKELLVLPGHGHNEPLPPEFFAALKGFLGRHAP